MTSRLALFVTLGLAVAPRPEAFVAGARGHDAVPEREAIVTVDLRALSPEGKPVLDLEPGDLALKVNGRPCEIRLLDLVRFAGDGAGAVPPPASLPSPFASNQFAPAGREVYLVFEDEAIAPGSEQAPRDAALHLIESLEPRDRVAVLTVPRGGIDTGLTADRSVVRTALAGRLGRAARAESWQEATCRTRKTLGALTAVLDSVRGGPGTTVVFFSSALTPPSSDNAVMGAANELCPVRVDDFKEVARAARDARATLYAVHVFDGAVIGTANSGAGLESLAGATDGELVRLSRNNTRVLDRVARETAASYVLGFPMGDARPGSQLRLEVKATRPGIRLRAPSQLTLPAGQAGRVAATARSTRDMLRVSTVYRDLPLRAVSYQSRNEGDDKVKLVVLFETIEPSASLASAMVGVFDQKGRLVAQSTAREEELASSPTLLAVPVNPGAYRVRTVATDSRGRAGSVDIESRAELAKAGPIRLSTLVLGASQAGTFVPRLEFANEPVTTAYLEVYQVSADAAVTVDLELAAGEDAPALSRAAGTVREASTADLRLVFGSLPIASLPPGDYQVRAIVRLGGQVVGRAARTLRKTAR